MPGRFRHGRNVGGFTLIELLIVVCIIAILVAMFMPSISLVQSRLTRLRCQHNLRNCWGVLMEYASNNKCFMPSFSGSNPMEVIQEYNTTGDMNWTVEELKSYGAKAEIFSCPASPEYENEGSTYWQSWTKPRISTSGTNTVKTVYTSGYAFYIAFWNDPKVTGQGRPCSRWYSYWQDGREFAHNSTPAGNPPLASDLLRFDPSPWGSSRYWKGFNHKLDNSTDEPGAGGHTLFVDGTCMWFDWAELEAGLSETPPTQPAWHGASSWNWFYFCGLRANAGDVGQ